VKRSVRSGKIPLYAVQKSKRTQTADYFNYHSLNWPFTQFPLASFNNAFLGQSLVKYIFCCSYISRDRNFMMKKISIIMACWATVIASAIIMSLLFGMDDKLELFFYLHFTIGTVMIFILFWPFLLKRLHLKEANKSFESSSMKRAAQIIVYMQDSTSISQSIST
jgi:hypothetical protein